MKLMQTTSNTFLILNLVLKDHKGEKGYDFVSAGAIHIEPIGIYSKKYKSLKDLPKNGTVIMRDAVAEQGRILSIFEKAGVIKLKPGVKKTDAQIKDIVENPKNLKFKADVEGALMTFSEKKKMKVTLLLSMLTGLSMLV